MFIVNILGPIILLVALGAVLRTSGFASESFFKQTNRLVFWVGLPALLFHKTSAVLPELSTAAGIVGILLSGVLICSALGYLAAGLLKLPRPAQAALVQGAYRGNLAYIGLPVVLYALDGAGLATPANEALALLAIVPMIPVYNIVAVLVLLRSRGNESIDYARHGGKLLHAVITNPLVVSCVAGVTFAYSGLPLPLLLDRTLSAVGQMALPLALLGIGASLRVWAIREGGWAAVAATGIKVIAAPLTGYGLARLLGISGLELQITLLYLSMPTAVMSYVMADRMGADGRLAGSIVVVSTLAAMPVLAFVLAVGFA